jgi:type II secretory pathway component GspD/PulD (secretin)
MNRLGRKGLMVAVLALASVAAAPTAPAGGTASAPAEPVFTVRPVATAPIQVTPATTTGPATSATRPTVAQLLPGNTATLEFHDATIPQIMDFITKTYGIEIFNEYSIKGLVTMKSENATARQAINSLNSMILGLGFVLVESVRGEPPRVVLTVVPTRSDAGSLVPFFYGNDPEKIPEGDDMRTQSMTFSRIDAEKVRTYLSAVIGKQAEISVNPVTKTITLTDTATHVHAAAALLQTLEQQAQDRP